MNAHAFASEFKCGLCFYALHRELAALRADSLRSLADSIGFKPTRNTFALRVAGDSMIGRHILDGDLVVLEHGPEPRNGQIVAALIDRECTLKTFIMRNGRPYLRAENPKYPKLFPAEELVIQGVFKALIRKAAE